VAIALDIRTATKTEWRIDLGNNLFFQGADADLLAKDRNFDFSTMRVIVPPEGRRIKRKGICCRA
jgi:hypothetical protein